MEGPTTFDTLGVAGIKEGRGSVRERRRYVYDDSIDFYDM